jgi:hypothetical protein
LQSLICEDKKKIKELLQKPWNPYIRHHSALTEKTTKLKLHTLNQHVGWSMNSTMAQKYTHYFGNESSETFAFILMSEIKLSAKFDCMLFLNCQLS